MEPSRDPGTGALTFVATDDPRGTAGAGLVPPARVRRRPHLPPRRGHVGGPDPGPAGRPPRVPAGGARAGRHRVDGPGPGQPGTRRRRLRRPLGARAARLPRARLAGLDLAAVVGAARRRRRTRWPASRSAARCSRRRTADADEPLPLLVVHDGPEYVRLARLLDLLDLAGDAATAPLRCRVLLLQPVDRDLAYAASPAYTEALVQRALPRGPRRWCPTVGPLVGLGASLGALALTHAAATLPRDLRRAAAASRDRSSCRASTPTSGGSPATSGSWPRRRRCTPTPRRWPA